MPANVSQAKIEKVLASLHATLPRSIQDCKNGSVSFGEAYAALRVLTSEGRAAKVSCGFLDKATGLVYEDGWGFVSCADGPKDSLPIGEQEPKWAVRGEC
jgi:hypothetical protein